MSKWRVQLDNWLDPVRKHQKDSGKFKVSSKFLEEYTEMLRTLIKEHDLKEKMKMIPQPFSYDEEDDLILAGGSKL